MDNRWPGINVGVGRGVGVGIGVTVGIGVCVGAMVAGGTVAVGGNTEVAVAGGGVVAVGRGARVGVAVGTIITGSRVRLEVGKGVFVGTKTGVMGVLVMVGGGGVLLGSVVAVTPGARVTGNGVLLEQANAPRTIREKTSNNLAENNDMVGIGFIRGGDWARVSLGNKYMPPESDSGPSSWLQPHVF